MRKQGLKKFILSVLIATLSVGVLSGCGAEKNNKSTAVSGFSSGSSTASASKTTTVKSNNKYDF